MKDLTDEQIMISVSSGNLDLASILFDRYQVKIYNYLLKNISEDSVDYDKDINNVKGLITLYDFFIYLEKSVVPRGGIEPPTTRFLYA